MAPLTAEPWVRSYGAIDGGFEVVRAAWPRLEHVFSVRRSEEEEIEGEGSPKPSHAFKEPHRLFNTMLSKFPVYLLTVERGSSNKPPLKYERETWEKLVSRTESSKQPRVIIEAWPPNAQLWTKGPTCKSTMTRWHEMG
jgi:hypothetical protein